MGRIEACLDKLAATCSAQTVYFDDTRGALYNEQVEMLTKLFMEKLPGRVVGFSGANNLQMSVANSVVARICWTDPSWAWAAAAAPRRPRTFSAS